MPPLRLLIIGNGPAGAQAALTIRRRLDPSLAHITLVSDEHDYFFSRTALMYAFMDRMERSDLEPYERRVWDAQHIQRIRARATDLDADAHTITLDDGQQLSYDKLLIATGASPRRAPWPGAQASPPNLIYFVSMQDLDAAEALAQHAQRAIVVGGGLIGIELVECLLFHKISTTFLIREHAFWPAALIERESRLVEDHMRAHGVDLKLNAQIKSLDLDDQQRVQTVTTLDDHALPCDMLGVCIGVQASCDWLKLAKTPPKIERAICVGADFATSLPDVWAAGDCVQIDLGDPTQRPLIETIWYSAKRHGQLAARAMMGDHVRYQPPVFFNSSKLFEIEYTTVGQTTALPAGSRALWRQHPTRPITQLICYDDDQRVLGFNLLGSRWDHRMLMSWIMERRTLPWVTQHLASAQFDVEFGRAPLSAMHEEEITL